MADARESASRDRLYRNILVPTDGSDGARRGTRHALDIGNQYGATIHALHVVDERTQAQTPALGSEELLIEKLEAEAESVLEAVVTEAEQLGLEAVARSCRGVPHDEIRRYAEENGIDLIVMGMHGRGGATRPHIGSTTERLIRTSEVPVLPV